MILAVGRWLAVLLGFSLFSDTSELRCVCVCESYSNKLLHVLSPLSKLCACMCMFNMCKTETDCDLFSALMNSVSFTTSVICKVCVCVRDGAVGLNGPPAARLIQPSPQQEEEQGAGDTVGAMEFSMGVKRNVLRH